MFPFVGCWERDYASSNRWRSIEGCPAALQTNSKKVIVEPVDGRPACWRGAGIGLAVEQVVIRVDLPTANRGSQGKPQVDLAGSEGHQVPVQLVVDQANSMDYTQVIPAWQAVFVDVGGLTASAGKMIGAEEPD